MFLWTRVCQLIIKYEDMRLKDSRDNLKRLIAFISLNYRHWFMVSLHTVDSRSQTRKID